LPPPSANSALPGKYALLFEKSPWTNSCSMFHLAVADQLRDVNFFRKSQ
jgi:hypothetical protein